MSCNDLEESEFCECGVTLMGDPGERDGLCGVCAGAPHGRDCPCDECDAYWARVCEESKVAADEANRALVCTCGWTGPFIEYHRNPKPGCVVSYRDPERAEFWRRQGWNVEPKVLVPEEGKDG